MIQHIERHRCRACDPKKLTDFEVVHVRPIYFGKVYTLNCPEGHLIVEWRRQ